MRQNNQRFLGQLAEKAAAAYLQKQGLKLLSANYNCKMGEIDIIMQQGEIYVFVEVRYREGDDCGSSLESVTRAKQNKIIRAAKFYLLENNLYDKKICRFDVVSSKPYAKDSEILWIKDAFWVKY